MPRIDGKEEALKLLNHLSTSERRKLLDELRSKDQALADYLEANLVKLEDIVFLSPTQLVLFLRNLDLYEFGVALRIVEEEVVSKILQKVSTGIRLDIEDGLKGPLKKMSEVQELQNKIVLKLKEKIDKGEIVLDKDEKTV